MIADQVKVLLIQTRFMLAKVSSCPGYLGSFALVHRYACRDEMTVWFWKPKRILARAR